MTAGTSPLGGTGQGPVSRTPGARVGSELVRAHLMLHVVPAAAPEAPESPGDTWWR